MPIVNMAGPGSRLYVPPSAGSPPSVAVAASATVPIVGALGSPASYAHPGGPIIASAIVGYSAAQTGVNYISIDGTAPDEVLVSQTGSNIDTGNEMVMYAAVWYSWDAGTVEVGASFTNTAFGNIRLASISGANLADPIHDVGAFFSNTPDTACSNSLLALPANTLVIDHIGPRADVSASLAEDDGQTELGSPTSVYATSGASYKVGTGTVTMGWSWGEAANRNHIMVAIKGAA